MAKTTYLNRNIRLMWITGTFKIQTKSAFKKKLFQIWRIVLNLMTLYLTVAFSVDIVQKGSKDLSLVVLSYMYVIITMTTLIRMNYFYAFDKKSEGILEQIHELFKYRTETHLEEKDLSGCINLANKITTIWIVTATLAAHSFVLATLIFNPSSERILPLPLWLPYDWKISPLYELTIAYLIFIHQMMVLAVAGTDMFFASTIILTCGQFRLLGWEVKNLLYTVLIKNGIDKESFSTNDNQWQEHIGFDFSRIFQQKGKEGILKLKKLRSDLLADLNQLVRFHQSLMKFCQQIEEFFSQMYLPFFLSALITNIFIIFVILMIRDLAITITLGLYITCTTISLFLPCYFGQLLMEQAEALHYDVYDSPWYTCDENFKTVLKCLHLRTSKPMILTVGKFATLSLSAFLWILRTIISYVTVLYQLTEDNRNH